MKDKEFEQFVLDSQKLIASKDTKMQELEVKLAVLKDQKEELESTKCQEVEKLEGQVDSLRSELAYAFLLDDTQQDRRKAIYEEHKPKSMSIVFTPKGMETKVEFVYIDKEGNEVREDVTEHSYW